MNFFNRIGSEEDHFPKVFFKYQMLVDVKIILFAQIWESLTGTNEVVDTEVDLKFQLIGSGESFLYLWDWLRWKPFDASRDVIVGLSCLAQRWRDDVTTMTS